MIGRSWLRDARRGFIISKLNLNCKTMNEQSNQTRDFMNCIQKHWSLDLEAGLDGRHYSQRSYRSPAQTRCKKCFLSQFLLVTCFWSYLWRVKILFYKIFHNIFIVLRSVWKVLQCCYALRHNNWIGVWRSERFISSDRADNSARFFMTRFCVFGNS